MLALLDEFMPYTDDESRLGAVSAAKRNAKTALRDKLAAAIITYKESKQFPALSIGVDMVEVIKRMKSEN